MRYLQLKRKIQTVGTWYFATFIGDVLCNYQSLQDIIQKKAWIKNLKESAAGGDISYKSTITKVNAMLAVIRAQQVGEALGIIVKDTNPRKVPDGTIECAEAMILCIENGRILLP